MLRCSAAIMVMHKKSMIALRGRLCKELWALVDNGAMHAILNWADQDVRHTINLVSLIDHNDHCQMHDGFFVCNCGIYGTSIGMPGLFIKTVDIAWL